MKKNSCTPINPKKYSCNGLNKIHAKNLITKKNSCSSKIPLPPHNFSNGRSLMCRSPVTCLVAEVWPALEVKPGEKKTTQSCGKRKKRLAHLARVPHCAFDCLLLLTRPNNACCVGYTYWRCMHHCLMLGVVVRRHLFLVKNCQVFETN